MTDKQYVKKTYALYEELALVSSSEDFDLDAFNDVHARILALHFCWLSNRRRRSWFAIASVCFILLMLAWVVYSIFF